MKPLQIWTLLMCLGALLLPETAVQAQRRGRPGPPSEPRTPPPVEFLGWDYAQLGYTLSPGEEVALLFRNHQSGPWRTAVAWELTTYAGESLAKGRSELDVPSGEIGRVPIALPPELQDGAYFVEYSTGSSGRSGSRRFHFDFRRPLADDKLNLTLVAHTENVDAEGWTRMLLGPLAPYLNVLNHWPSDQRAVDAALVIAETIRDGDPRLGRLKQYVEQGGKLVVFGKPAASLLDLLPVQLEAGHSWLEKPQRIRVPAAGPWQGFDPEQGPTRYGVRVQAKADADVLASWDDGTPAVVAGRCGQGQVVFVASGSGQVWQNRPSLEGADELALRLLYWLTRGEAGVAEMLACAERLYKQETAGRTAVRDRVLENLGAAPPDQFVVVSRNNVGRFGWLVEEGGLVENLGASGKVSGPGTRAFSFGGTQPVVNVGALQSTGAEAS